MPVAVPDDGEHAGRYGRLELHHPDAVVARADGEQGHERGAEPGCDEALQRAVVIRLEGVLHGVAGVAQTVICMMAPPFISIRINTRGAPAGPRPSLLPNAAAHLRLPSPASKRQHESLCKALALVRLSSEKRGFQYESRQLRVKNRG